VNVHPLSAVTDPKRFVAPANCNMVRFLHHHHHPPQRPPVEAKDPPPAWMSTGTTRNPVGQQVPETAPRDHDPNTRRSSAATDPRAQKARHRLDTKPRPANYAPRELGRIMVVVAEQLRRTDQGRRVVLD
jgi:hypothetical protein